MSTEVSSATPRVPPAPARRPELLAPAGDWECVHAAVENGADAIYFGLERFNARMRAKNFTAADLPRLMEFLHRRGVRGYVTFNTLVFSDELDAAEGYLRALIAAGVDAAIVQDVGICRMIRALSDDFPIHCSTQMTVTSAAGVEFARGLGANLVVLARENSLREIAAIRAAQGVSGLPLEVFVHGALCVAYSGQCLTSESLGGRSANRGECAQACRMPYELVSDGQKVELGDRRYLLSPQDLAGLDVLPELVASGVVSLKIEGRLKSPEYVANITSVYRKALDRVLASPDETRSPGVEHRPVDPTLPPLHAKPSTLNSVGTAISRKIESNGRGDELDNGTGNPSHRDRFPVGEKPLNSQPSTFNGPGPTSLPPLNPHPSTTISPSARYDLEMGFSRGLYTGWFRGINNQELAHARFGTKRGVYLGRVTRVGRDHVVVAREAPLKAGDGLVFDAGRPDEKEEGGRVYQVDDTPAGTRLAFGRDDIDFDRVQVGHRVWKTNDPELDRRVRRSFEGDHVRHRRTVHAEVHGTAGGPLTLLLRHENGLVARADSTVPLERATHHPLDSASLREQIGRLGGTPFELESLTAELDGEVMLPVSALNEVRRRAAAELEELCSRPPRWHLRESRAAPIEGPIPPPTPPDDTRAEPEIIAVVRRPGQLAAAWDAGARTIYCEFENPKTYREAVASFREMQRATDAAGSSIWVAAPRVFKPGEEWILQQVLSCEADGYLVRNFDHLQAFAGRRVRGDFSLNVANPWTAAYFLRRFGLERVTASYDLNVAQLEALLRTAPASWFEVTLHQHMPMFHMEHCVFCAFLSDGTDYRNCGRPCDRHDVRLRDRVGAEHPLRADAGCRNTVFNSRAQTGAEFAHRLVALGAKYFRIEFLLEDPDEVTRVIRAYQRLFRGEVTGADLWREFRLINQLGVTRGQLEADAQIIRRKH
ncbi:MAG TPA: DUF3656 domain-containing protein [Candidatus Didemnitutus sp.]|jgi:putative protease